MAEDGLRFVMDWAETAVELEVAVRRSDFRLSWHWLLFVLEAEAQLIPDFLRKLQLSLRDVWDRDKLLEELHTRRPNEVGHIRPRVLAIHIR